MTTKERLLALADEMDDLSRKLAFTSNNEAKLMRWAERCRTLAESLADGDAEDAARYRWLSTVTPYRFTKMQQASAIDASDVTYFDRVKFDAAVDAARQSPGEGT